MAKDIHNAAGFGNLKEIQRFVKRGVSIDERGPTGMTPLMVAAYYFHNDVLKW